MQVGKVLICFFVCFLLTLSNDRFEGDYELERNWCSELAKLHSSKSWRILSMACSELRGCYTEIFQKDMRA